MRIWPEKMWFLKSSSDRELRIFLPETSYIGAIVSAQNIGKGVLGFVLPSLAQIL